MKTVIGYLHTHWDREWYREFDAFRIRLIEVIDEVSEKLENSEIPYFYFDGQTAALEDYLEIRPEMKGKIERLIREKKTDIGPFYCSTDSFLVSGELYLRNLCLGIKKSLELGEKRYIAYIADSFGHSEKIVNILKSFNIDKAILWRGLGNNSADLIWNDIKTTYLIQGYFQDYLTANTSTEEKSAGIKHYIDKISEKSSDIVLLPIGGDHLGIPNNAEKQLKKLNLKDYKIILASPFDYFAQIKKRTPIKGEFLDNSLNFILPGIYSSRPDIKQQNAICQWNLTRLSEPVQSILGFFFNTRNMQSEIDFAYKLLIKNHAHDSIYGCSTDKVNKDILNRYKRVRTISEEIINTSLYSLQKRKNNSESLSVINLSNFEYSGIIKIKTDKKLPKWLNGKIINTENAFPPELVYNSKYVPITEDYTRVYTYLINVKDLPAFSLTKLTKENINKNYSIKTTKNSVENNFLKIEINDNSIYFEDKTKNKIYSDFLKIYDAGDSGDSYNFGAVKEDVPVSAKLKSYKISNKKLYADLRLTFNIKIPITSTSEKRSNKKDNCNINVSIRIYNSSKNAEFKVDWINKSQNHLLKLGFNFIKPIKKTINEDLFGTVERKFNPDFDIYSKIPAPKGTEIKPNTSPMQRFVSAQGITIITKGISEYEIHKNTLYLTLLRSTGIISNPKNSTRGTPAGPPVETPDLQMTGENKREFALCFTDDIQEMFKQTEEFYRPALSVISDEKSTQFFKINNENILIYAIKRSDKGLVLRLANITSSVQSAKIESNFELAQTNPLEDKFIKTAKRHNFNFKPNEIKTVILLNP